MFRKKAKQTSQELRTAQDFVKRLLKIHEIVKKEMSRKFVKL